jgi:hypothetical protein
VLGLLIPRPDVGSLLVAAAVGSVAYLLGASAGASVLLALVSSVVALPILIVIREVQLFTSRDQVSENDVGMIAEWLDAVTRAAGGGGAVTLYVYRKGTGLQVLQLGGDLRLDRGGNLAVAMLVHRAAWSGFTVAEPLHPGKLVVLLPAAVASLIRDIVERGGRGVYVTLKSQETAKMVYRIIKTIVSGLHRSASRAYVAYLATKVLAALLIRGRIRADEALAHKLDEIIPSEPFWIKKKVVEQLQLEGASIYIEGRI